MSRARGPQWDARRRAGGKRAGERARRTAGRWRSKNAPSASKKAGEKTTGPRRGPALFALFPRGRSPPAAGRQPPRRPAVPPSPAVSPSGPRPVPRSPTCSTPNTPGSPVPAASRLSPAAPAPTCCLPAGYPRLPAAGLRAAWRGRLAVALPGGGRRGGCTVGRPADAIARATPPVALDVEVVRTRRGERRGDEHEGCRGVGRAVARDR